MSNELRALLQTRLQTLFQKALQEHAFSGASVLVAHPEQILLEATYGAVSHVVGAPAITITTWFDLASLTKPLVTGSLAMAGIAGGWLRLEEPLRQAMNWRRVPDVKGDITVRQLLNHCSGLPAYREYFRSLVEIPEADRRERLMDWVLQESLLGAPQTTTAYSDLGFMVLTAIIEKRLGIELNEAAQRLLFAPAGIFELSFRPARPAPTPETLRVSGSQEPTPVFAQTEQCQWRSRTLEGEVHDENTFALGGVAGHAGLFGTARGVHSWLSVLWRAYRGTSGHQGIEPSLVREFWRRQDLVPGSTWALSFDTPNASRSSAGEWFSAKSVGHLGFTGTSFWLDLDREILVILLTNRVHPHRDNSSLKSFRPLLHNVIMETVYAR